MPYFADIYVIKNTRSKKLGIEFLNHFLPNRKESSDEYLLPQYEIEANIEFQNAEDLMDYVENYPNIEYSIYWRNLDDKNKNRHGIVFYTSDSYMIFGISREHSDFENHENEEECLAEMKAFFETDEGYITYECPPEDNFPEFANLVKQYNQSKNV